MAVSETRDTKDRLLDSAEELFADRGFAATSMRSLTARAGVNLAAVNYHFGSKEALIEAVFARRLKPINVERLELLTAQEQAAGAQPLAIEGIVECFIGPPLRSCHDAGGGRVFMRLLGHAMNQPKEQIRKSLAGQFREVVGRFSAALSQALPGLPAEERFWRMLFMAGAMSHTMAMSDQVGLLSGGVCDSADAEKLIRRLVPFLSAGLRAASEDGTGGTA